jgi:hypothetical protein
MIEVTTAEIVENKVHAISEAGRGITDYAFSLQFDTNQDFVAYIDGKTVLDLGSGSGGLAKAVSIQKVDANIISYNPRLATLEGRKNERRMTSQQLSNTDFVMVNQPSIHATDEEVECAQAYHDQRAVAGFAQRLPFKSENIDVVLDANALGLYRLSKEAGDSFNPHLMVQEYLEVLRVLKHGGVVRTNLDSYYDHQDVNTLIYNVLRAVQESAAIKDIQTEIHFVDSNQNPDGMYHVFEIKKI